jgi:hypothetical protein
MTRRRSCGATSAALKPSCERVLNQWDPIRGSPDDEYDCLIPQLYAQLRSGASSDQIEAFLADEPKHHFGLDPSPAGDREFSTRLARILGGRARLPGARWRT